MIVWLQHEIQQNWLWEGNWTIQYVTFCAVAVVPNRIQHQNDSMGPAKHMNQIIVLKIIQYKSLYNSKTAQQKAQANPIMTSWKGLKNYVSS